MNANQVNASPGVPAWWASEKSRAEASPPACSPAPRASASSRRTPKKSGTSSEAEQRLLVDPRPEEADQAAPAGCPDVRPAAAEQRRPAARGSSKPRSTSRLSPTRATARTRLSTAIPSRHRGENRQSRAVDRLPGEQDDDQAQRQEPVVGQPQRGQRRAASRRRPRSARPRPTRRRARATPSS